MIGKQFILIISGVCLSLMFGITGCRSSNENDLGAIPTLVSPAKEEYVTQKVIKGTVEKISTIRGKVVPVTKMDMYFKGKGGYLTKFNVKAGDMVKKGDVIATLDDTDVKYSIKQEEIKLKLAELSYGEAVKNNVSDYDQQKASLLLQSEKLQMEQLNNSLKGCTLSSGMTGKIIFAADVKLAQNISSFQTLVTIADINTYQIQCDTKNTDFPVGSKVNINILHTNYDGEVVTNTAMEKKSEDDTKKASDYIIINFTNLPQSLNLGEGADVTCTSAKKENILVVPSKSITLGAGNHPLVQVLSNGDKHERFIETGIDDGTNTEVISGITEGEEIVTN